MQKILKTSDFTRILCSGQCVWTQNVMINKNVYEVAIIHICIYVCAMCIYTIENLLYVWIFKELSV